MTASDRTTWQPIETAPRDGTDILCACRAEPGDAYYYLVLGWDEDGKPGEPYPWWTLDGPRYPRGLPKLWQPIQEPIS